MAGAFCLPLPFALLMTICSDNSDKILSSSFCEPSIFSDTVDSDSASSREPEKKEQLSKGSGGGLHDILVNLDITSDEFFFRPLEDMLFWMPAPFLTFSDRDA